MVEEAGFKVSRFQGFKGKNKNKSNSNCPAPPKKEDKYGNPADCGRNRLLVPDFRQKIRHEVPYQ